ncbi:hypothetical protein [Geminocystis sp. NIES-3709]|uniref:hypothetical protein n=1 Tax=Geminocystis sp. NIES-3709 TaxID=1617448 RepID=UPI0005FC9AB8|nr:hypothetical protein [Geminocystis sp. NIES-3709]BAQ67074.1 hypothetical protein GM3709_3839 [Geminocystis sp. NIES-3709]
MPIPIGLAILGSALASYVAGKIIEYSLEVPPVADGTVPKKPVLPPSLPPSPPINVTNNYSQYNVIRHTNTNIYNQYSNIFVVSPILPSRSLPQQLGSTSSDTEFMVANTVTKSLANRKYGGLLAKPFYDDEVNICSYTQINLSQFLTNLFAELVADETEEIEGMEEPQNTIDKLAVVFMSFADDAPPMPIPTLKAINQLAIYYGATAKTDGFDVTGLISVGNINIIDCSRTLENDDLPPMTVSFNDECGVPITMFDDLEGYKADQLQIWYRNLDWNINKKPKYFTLPSPIDIDIISNQLLKSVLPDTFTFGNTLIEIWFKIRNNDEAVRPIQKCQIYTEHKNKDDCFTFVNNQVSQWVNALTKDVEIKAVYPQFFEDGTFWKGQCKLYKAVLMGWDRDKKHWCNKAHWYP